MVDPDTATTPAPTILAGWHAVMALLVVVVLEAFLWTVTRVFVLNFSTAGPNVTAGLTVLLASGWSLAVVARVGGAPARWVPVTTGLLVVGFAVSLVDAALVAGLGGALVVTAATPVLFALLGGLRERVAVGVSAGLLLWVGLRTALDTASPYATTSGQVGFGAVVVGAAALGAGLALRDSFPTAPFRGLGEEAAPLGALLVAAPAYLASPNAVSRWMLRSYEATVLALVLGLAAGLLLLHVRPVPRGPELLAWAVGFLLAVAAVLYGSGPASTAAFAVAWAAGVVLLAAGSRPGSAATGPGAVPLVVVQLVGIVALFGYVSASNWAFMPAPLDAARGRAAEFLLVLCALLPVSVLLAVRTGPAVEATPRPRESRRTLLGTVATGLVPLAALGAPEYDPASGPPVGGTKRLRVMAYNLHLFFEEDDAGRYNLEALLSVIEDSGADVVAVSESDGCRPLSGNVDGLRWLGRRLDYHVEFGAPSRIRGYGVGVLSRWPIESVRVVELPVSRSPPRLAVVATVRTPTGPLPVIATHFMTEKPGDVRDRQAERVVDLAADHERAVVLGDFNVEPDPTEPAYRTLEEAFTDAWTAADRRKGGPDTWSAADPRKRIDYVWLRGEWTVHEAAVLGSPRASDHLAILAEIEPG